MNDMGLNKEEEREEYLPSVLRHSFHIICFSLLSLLLPLSFLLLARVSTSSNPSTLSPSHPASSLLRADLFLLGVLVTVISVGAAVHTLTGHRIRPSAAVAWGSLCVMQLCIMAGMESTAVARVGAVSSAGAGEHVPWIKHVILLVGLYKTMRFWGKTIVKPVADDAVFRGREVDEKSGKLVVCVAFMALWMYLLRSEVEAMVFGAVERGLRHETGSDGYVRWLVSHATIATGIARIVKGLVDLGRLLLWRDEEDEGCHSSASVDDKV